MIRSPKRPLRCHRLRRHSRRRRPRPRAELELALELEEVELELFALLVAPAWTVSPGCELIAATVPATGAYRRVSSTACWALSTEACALSTEPWADAMFACWDWALVALLPCDEELLEDDDPRELWLFEPVLCDDDPDPPDRPECDPPLEPDGRREPPRGAAAACTKEAGWSDPVPLVVSAAPLVVPPPLGVDPDPEAEPDDEDGEVSACTSRACAELRLACAALSDSSALVGSRSASSWPAATCWPVLT